jgi:long-chain acyl-CoA synthetase
MAIGHIWVEHYEPGVCASLDYPKGPLFTFLDESAEKYPDRFALIFGEVARGLPGDPLLDAGMTYRQLSASVNRLANALEALVVKG